MRNVARGLLIGMADALPGISGGTVAYLLGVHARLVGALAFLTDRMPLRQKLRDERLSFLVVIGLGIVAGVVLGAKVLVRVLDAAPAVTAAVLLGLMAATALGVARRLSWTASTIGLACLAALAALSIGWFVPGTLPLSSWTLFVAGAFAACAMVLPGISGAYLLLLVGLYEPMIHAVAELQWERLVPMAVGNVLGMLLFTRVLRRGLEHHATVVHAVLVGLLVGSLTRLWPWRTEAAFAAGDATLPGLDALWWVLLAGALLGLVLPTPSDND